ncbi:MAG: alpha/beta fold hydrolase, partial [Magnetococcales bacterium]|nr:alpha/beta fold hydrolase [Magnetococcales bacterium]
MKLWGHQVWSGPGPCRHGSLPDSALSITDHSFFLPGGKAAILLIHGLTGTPNEMRSVGKGLASSGLTVLGMQIAGHCGSEAALLGTTWMDWYASVEVAFQQLACHHAPIFAVGLCAGALLALHLAKQHPEGIQGLALYGTTLRYDGWALPRLNFLVPWVVRTPLSDYYRFVEVFPFGIKDERIRQKIVSGMLAGNSAEAGSLGMTGRSLREFFHLGQVVKREMGTITAPTLILHAIDDDVASVKNAEYAARHLGGPSKTILLDDSYHLITIDRQRHDVVRHTVEFFSPLTGSATTDGLRPYRRVVRGENPLQVRQLVVANSITCIDPRQWDDCFSDQPGSWSHLLALERTMSPKLQLRYLAVSDGRRLLAAVPAFHMPLSLETMIGGRLSAIFSKWVRRLPGSLGRWACLGSPATNHCRVGFAPDVDQRQHPILLAMLLQQFQNDADVHGCRVLGTRQPLES